MILVRRAHDRREDMVTTITLSFFTLILCITMKLRLVVGSDLPEGKRARLLSIAYSFDIISTIEYPVCVFKP